MVGRFLKPQFRAQHERLGFLTARNHVRRPLVLALVDQPMAQLYGCASHFCGNSVLHIARACELKRGERTARQPLAWKAVGTGND
jgi:hypothetical protein